MKKVCRIECGKLQAALTDLQYKTRTTLKARYHQHETR